MRYQVDYSLYLYKRGMKGHASILVEDDVVRQG